MHGVGSFFSIACTTCNLKEQKVFYIYKIYICSGGAGKGEKGGNGEGRNTTSLES